MKKIIQSVVCSALLVGFTANAQTEKINGNGNVVTQTRTTSEYDAIKISGFFDVDLVAGKEGKITIKGEENILNVIVVEVEDNALKIHVKKGTNVHPSSGKKVEITVPFEKISELNLSGSGDIVSRNQIKNDSFTVRLSGSGDIDLDVASNSFDFSLSGSGDVKLKGSSDNVVVKLSGSGDIDAANLKSKNATVNVSGSGDVKVNCNESITARVSGSGDIKYAGNPEKRDAKVSGSGSVSKV
ncbi:head GIN domain-containing protein [Flavobacterium denitrificans]|uniref:head GIN domain-containing protein n=1 Tax=Flavobacterium denitrificans TaxID=281361 RepID=UPI0003FA8800|nr:head GIN domain-containing protein [Flavobacterium denitrificans]